MQYPKIFQTLEFEKIQKALFEHIHTAVGKEKVMTLMPDNDFDVVTRWQNETQEGVTILSDNRVIPVPRLNDLSPSFHRLRLGAGLNGRELAAMMKLLKSVTEIIAFFDCLHEENKTYPHLEAWADQLIALPNLYRDLALALDEEGNVLSTASVELGRIRRQQVAIEDQVRNHLNQLLRSKGNLLSDSLITIRNNRYVLPVKAEYRYQFGGTVHDQSSTGQTLYIEPQSVVQWNNQRSDLQAAERKEIDRILLALSQALMPHHATLSQNEAGVGQFDFIQAKAAYARDLEAVQPRFSQNQHIALWQARHPLIPQDQIVPNDILLGEHYRTLVITGPNTGGKTILLKTLGIIQLMGQVGLHVPCQSGSQLALFDHIFADIGDEQSIEQNLSTFSGHMTNIVRILGSMTEQSLLLFDELGSGTDPQEGAALAMAILNYGHQQGAMVMATTHYPELKVYAHQTPGTINASMEFDSQTLAPTYRLLIGIPGRSNALEISKRLGLPEAVLAMARKGISQDSQSVNEMIANLERERRETELNNQQAQVLLEQAQQLHQDLTDHYCAFREQKEAMMEKAKHEANEKVVAIQRDAEKVLREIRDLQLEQGQAKTVKEHVLIDKKAQFEQLKVPENLKQNKVLRKAKQDRAYQVGDDVEVLSYGQRGTLIEQVSAKEYIVQMGILKLKVDSSDLQPLAKIEPRVKVNIQRKAGSKVLTSIDLRGLRYDDAMQKTKQYLDQALLSHHPMVTIIHGKGTGALREGIQQLLKKHPQVERFEYAPPNAGGSGATLVYFVG